MYKSHCHVCNDLMICQKCRQTSGCKHNWSDSDLVCETCRSAKRRLNDVDNQLAEWIEKILAHVDRKIENAIDKHEQQNKHDRTD